jgi:plastocyanin
MMLAIAGQAQVTHELAVEDDQFNPSTLTINAGDHVHILWDNSVVNDHSFTQVSQSTWNVNGSTPLPGGFDFGVGTATPGTEFTITPTATVWYVCSFHASMGMKGVINVVGGSGIEEPAAQDLFHLAPNPATANVTVLAPTADPVIVRLLDGSGRVSTTVELSGVRTLDLLQLAEGMYVVEFRTMQGVLLSRQRLAVVR